MNHADHAAPPMHFGLLLKMRREQWDLKQREVLAHLPGWTQANYSRLESGVIAPAFEHLLPLYTALGLAGIQWTIADRQAFLELARRRIEAKKTHWERRSEAEWAELRYALANADLLPDEAAPASQKGTPPRPLLAETRHLVGREEWLATVLTAIENSPAKKLLVLQGPMGVGKSSELHRLARHFLHADHPAYQVLWLPLLPIERTSSPDASLEVFLGSLLAEAGDPLPSSSFSSVEARIAYVLAHLEHSAHPSVILVDNAEGVLTDEGMLAPCWEDFLERFLLSQHQATILLATKEWPGWAGRERVFVAETTVPLLSVQTGVLLLQHLGLERVPVQHLRAVCDRVGGIPLCLEWVAALVQDPLLLDDWRSFESGEEMHEDRTQQDGATQRLLQLLEEPALLRGHFASKLQPLLERIIEKRLSSEACRVLTLLAVSTIPLGKPALQVLCDRPRPLKELRDASLLVAYPSRVQLLPMVSSAVLQGLTPQQVQESEEQLISALMRWLQEGILTPREGGSIVTELVALLLTHHRLLEAAQQLLPYRSLSFNLGHAPRLARLAADVMRQFDWHMTAEQECGGLLLHYLFAPFLGETIDDEQRAAEYHRILDMMLSGKVMLQPSTQGHIASHLMLSAMNRLHFEEAQAVLDACCARLESLQPVKSSLQVYLLELRAWLFGAWCDYTEEQGERRTTQQLREQTIAFYRQCITIFSANEEQPLLKESLASTRLARWYNALSYHLARDGQFEEALHYVDRSIALKEQGYHDFGGLAAAYGEKAEILTELGRLQEALRFDEQALAEIQRSADVGHTTSQEERWMYLANRGRLYLRLGRVDEAEQLLQEAFPHISVRRRKYRMFAQEARDEIEQWRLHAPSPHYQFDWRWVERYRMLASFDSYWWLAPAGPFTGEEQRQWDQWSGQTMDEQAKERLGALIAQSRQHELEAALAEQREPCFRYPAIAIEEVRGRIAGLLQLDADISQQEPHAIVCRLYHDTIEEELDFLRLIEATHEGDTEQFWVCSQRLCPVPTREEMTYAVSRVSQMILQGLRHPETADISQQMVTFLRERLGLSLDPSPDEEAAWAGPGETNAPPAHRQRVVSPQAARQFFTTILREYGYEGWQVVIDPNATNARVEQGLRQLFLTEKPLSVEKIRHYVSHELAGHVARCVAGERSLLGLLGIHTRHSLETEEGLAVYADRQMAILRGQAYNDTALWTATLAMGLASGVVTPPQTFRSLYTFFESFYLLYQLLQRLHANVQKSREVARNHAASLCLRTYRGVPDLQRAGVCYTVEALYLRGLWKIEQAVAENETLLDRLAVGVVALEYLPDLQELGIVSAPQSLRKLVNDPELDTYILSFEELEERAGEWA